MNDEALKTPRWLETDSDEFIDHGKYFVPDRERQIETVCDLIPTPPKGAHLVELCCGEGLISRALLERFPTCHVHAFDGSTRMIEQTRSLLSASGDRFDTELFDLADRDWRRFDWPVHAVVSSLAIHHLDGQEKQLLFEDIENALAPGGCLIIADVILPTTEQGHFVAGKQWDLAVRERSLELAGDLRAFERFRNVGWNSFQDPEPDPIDKPSTLLEQLKWLENAGFSNVDAFWMLAGHVIFGGFKAET